MASNSSEDGDITESGRPFVNSYDKLQELASDFIKFIDLHPIEKKTTNVTTLQKGIDLVTKAIEEDRKRNYGKAVKLYEEAVVYLLHASEYEAHSAKAKETMRSKATQYLDRAEKLRRFLQKKKKGSNDEDDTDHAAAFSAVIQTKMPEIKWADVAGMEEVKQALTEAIILPLKFPQLFSGQRSFSASILLYGVAGCGKTYLAKSLATETTATFFYVSTYDLVSKWLNAGSETCVKKLFKQARERKPSIIFMDDIEAVCVSEGENISEEHRRVVQEFIVQMQHFYDNDSDGICVLGATNVPWKLDHTIRRMFVKRLYIPLPDLSARINMLKMHLASNTHCLTEDDFSQLGRDCDGFTGADVSILVRDALMQPVRKIQTATHFRKVRGPSRDNPEEIVDDLLTPCSPEELEAIEMDWMKVDGNKLLEPILSMTDFCKSLENMKPSVTDGDLQNMEQFTRQYCKDA